MDQHSLLLAPAERADVVVDFSKFAGKTLILYNDAPAAFPARIPSYDYYTGAPDLTPVGAPQILPGYGPNTRTIMQVKIAANAPAPAFNLSKLNTAFLHKANGTGVFESGQHPIIVGQAAYNTAYGTSFAASGWCNSPINPSLKCDGFARINEQGGDLFKFDTLRMMSDGSYPPGFDKVSVKIEPKAIQDETSESNFDEFGRMTAVLGLEVVPATPGMANTVLYGYAFPLVDIFDTSGLPRADVQVSPISSGEDGTQIWKITHNGVDTHPIHFHATDVQILNRVTWDNIIKPPHPSELGWKETIRVSPLEDTYVAIRPVPPVLPFDFPNIIRRISEMMPDGAWIANTTLAELIGLPIIGFAPNGEPIDIVNHYINYGAEYVYHCHILSHEEMDMMHAVSFVFPPVAPSDLTVTGPFGSGADRHVNLAWIDNSRSETGWEVQRASSAEGPWTTIATLPSDPANPVLQPGMGSSTGNLITYTDLIAGIGEDFLYYQVVAINQVGDTWDYSDPNLNEIEPGTFAFPVVTARSGSSNIVEAAIPPEDPTDLTATFQPATGSPTWLPPRVLLSWTDNADNETGFVIERSVNGGDFALLATIPALPGTGSVSYTDIPVIGNTNYAYRVFATNAAGDSGYSNTASLTTPNYPAAPSPVSVTCVRLGNNNARCTLTWTDVPDNTSYTVQWATNETFTSGLVTPNPNQQPGANASSYTTPNIARNTNFYFRIRSNNANGSSPWTNAMPFPVLTP